MDALEAETVDYDAENGPLVDATAAVCASVRVENTSAGDGTAEGMEWRSSGPPALFCTQYKVKNVRTCAKHASGCPVTA